MLKWIFSSAVLFSVVSVCYAAEKPFSENLNQALRAANKHEQFSVPFTQETYSALRDKVTLSEGVLSIQKPTSFRLEIISPRAELYVSDGHDFWKYNPGVKHAQHLDASAADFEFVKVLTDLSSLKKQYDVTPWTARTRNSNQSPVQSDALPPVAAGKIGIKLEPKKDKQQKVLYAIIDMKSGFMEELRLVHTNGNRIRMVFGSPSTKPLTREQFHFTPPDGVAVDK